MGEAERSEREARDGAKEEGGIGAGRGEVGGGVFKVVGEERGRCRGGGTGQDLIRGRCGGDLDEWDVVWGTATGGTLYDSVGSV